MGCSLFIFRLTITHMYSCFRVQALHIHTLMLESNYTAHSLDQNSPSTVLSLSTDVVLMKWSAITFASWEQINWRGSPRSSWLADACLASEKWRPLLVHTWRSPRTWHPLGTSPQPCTLSHIAVNHNTLLISSWFSFYSFTFRSNTELGWLSWSLWFITYIILSALIPYSVSIS